MTIGIEWSKYCGLPRVVGGLPPGSSTTGSAARTYGELAALVSDLPATPGSPTAVSWPSLQIDGLPRG
jgi:hypothetical protein